MNKRFLTKVLFLLSTFTGSCWAGCCSKSLSLECEKAAIKESPIDTILVQLKQKTAELKTYYGKIEYQIDQPLFESKTLRKGLLYYEKDDGRSALRINFNTLKQDDEKEQKYIEQYIFDGIWLTHINYQIKEVKRYQQAEPNNPADVFELAGRNLPIIGFSNIEDMKKEFEIELIEQKSNDTNDFICLHLKVKPNSIYKDDYTSVDVCIDKTLSLPAKITAVSVEGDIYKIKFPEMKVNEKIDKKVFNFEAPESFTQEVILLKENVNQ